MGLFSLKHKPGGGNDPASRGARHAAPQGPELLADGPKPNAALSRAGAPRGLWAANPGDREPRGGCVRVSVSVPVPVRVRVRVPARSPRWAPTASLMMRVMTALGRFRSSGLSAILGPPARQGRRHGAGRGAGGTARAGPSRPQPDPGPVPLPVPAPRRRSPPPRPGVPRAPPFPSRPAPRPPLPGDEEAPEGRGGRGLGGP